ncbi:MAG: hypothetical protein EP297_01800 [Gammaproteobacteria bacterium]|nr:MAG: hypothetical protein EP297_01800 [Gammaproteobacteria bacterium]
MTFITLAMMAFLCLFIPIALPVSAISAVILLYFYPLQTLALLVVVALGGVAYMYLKHRRKRRAY